MRNWFNDFKLIKKIPWRTSNRYPLEMWEKRMQMNKKQKRLLKRRKAKKHFPSHKFINSLLFSSQMAFFKKENNFKKDKFRNNSSKGKPFQQPPDSFRSNRRDRAESRESNDRFRQNQTFYGHEERPFGRNKPARKEETQAICDRCGKSCTLPFRPTANKPVYCSDCFRKNDSFQESKPSRSFGSSSSPDLTEINAKLDKIMRVLKIN